MNNWKIFETFDDACEAHDNELGCCQFFYTQFKCRVKVLEASDGIKLFFVQDIDHTHTCNDERYEITLIIDFERIITIKCKDGRTRTADSAIKKILKTIKMWSEAK